MTCSRIGRRLAALSPRLRFRPLWLGAAALAIVLGSERASALTFTCSGGDVLCLKSAINAANQTQEPDTILLAAGTYSLTSVDNSQLVGPAGLPIISTTIEIRGAGMFATRIERSASAPAFRILGVNGGDLTLGSLTIAGGMTAPGPLSAGGAGLVNFGHAFVTGVAFEGNVDALPAGTPAGGGGAIVNDNTINIVASLFDSNGSFGPGGAILNQATMIMRRSSIRNNTGGDGGGIANISDHFSVIDSCDVLNNHGSITGGILAQQAIQGLVINGTTIAGNGATDAAAGGAGLSARPGSLPAPVDIINCTVSDNFNRIGAAGNAGGIFADPAAIVHISNSILARNFLFDRFQQIPQDCVGAPQSFGHNAIDFLPGCSIVLSADFVGDPRLGTLADTKPADGIPEGNGAIPLLAGSPMIDWADPGQCQASDQLGFPRADGDLSGSAACDVGAVEFEPTVSSIIALVRTQTVHDPKPPTRDFPAGKDTITRQYKNKSSEQIVRPVFVVTTLTDQEMLLNCDPPAPGGVGARLTPDVGTDLIWGPNEVITVTFVIGLKTEANYRFSVDVIGYPQ